MYTPDLGGGLGADIDHTAATSAVLDLADITGSIATTLTLPATGNALNVNAYASYDEYGNPETSSTVTTGANSYGWLGTKQRAQAGAGLTLMGARLYNPTTGRFTSTDPVPGGNENAYVYPNDPVNKSDITGCSWWGDIGRGVVSVAKKALDSPLVRAAAVGIVTAAVCSTGVGCVALAVAAGAALGAANWAVNHRNESLSRHVAAGAVEGLKVGVVGRVLARAAGAAGFARASVLNPLKRGAQHRAETLTGAAGFVARAAKTVFNKWKGK